FVWHKVKTPHDLPPYGWSGIWKYSTGEGVFNGTRDALYDNSHLGESVEWLQSIQVQGEEPPKVHQYKCDMCNKVQKLGGKQVFNHEWYIPPSGCIGGDYWKHGYYYVVCDCGRRIEIAKQNIDDVPVPTRENHPGVCSVKLPPTPEEKGGEG
ncbi:hypothetical protein LCGC14_2170000, partial [marine sediment metagenome]